MPNVPMGVYYDTIMKGKDPRLSKQKSRALDTTPPVVPVRGFWPKAKRLFMEITGLGWFLAEVRAYMINNDHYVMSRT